MISLLSPEARAELERWVDERIREVLATERAKRWMSVTETAEYLGISEKAVRGRVESGRIPVKHHGRSLLVDRVALDRLIEKT